MKYSCEVFCTLQFEATHHCPMNVCPAGMEYLINEHRHIFHVRCKAKVWHDNRDIEFISLKHQIQNHIAERYNRSNLGTTSCEQIASEILDQFKVLDTVEVSEDNENGVIVSRNKE